MVLKRVPLKVQKRNDLGQAGRYTISFKDLHSWVFQITVPLYEFIPTKCAPAGNQSGPYDERRIPDYHHCCPGWL